MKCRQGKKGHCIQWVGFQTALYIIQQMFLIVIVVSLALKELLLEKQNLLTKTSQELSELGSYKVWYHKNKKNRTPENNDVIKLFEKECRTLAPLVICPATKIDMRRQKPHKVYQGGHLSPDKVILHEKEVETHLNFRNYLKRFVSN